MNEDHFPWFHFKHLHCPELDHRAISALFSSSYLFLRDQSLTDLMPLYKTMKKATFSDSEDEVCLHIYTCTLQFVFKRVPNMSKMFLTSRRCCYVVLITVFPGI